LEIGLDGRRTHPLLYLPKIFDFKILNFGKIFEIDHSFLPIRDMSLIFFLVSVGGK
jgi:hypothetical protein